MQSAGKLTAFKTSLSHTFQPAMYLCGLFKILNSCFRVLLKNQTCQAYLVLEDHTVLHP